ncbi:unnamed protein product [Parajaminaea phylloscopi]
MAAVHSASTSAPPAYSSSTFASTASLLAMMRTDSTHPAAYRQQRSPLSTPCYSARQQQVVDVDQLEQPAQSTMAEQTAYEALTGHGLDPSHWLDPSALPQLATGHASTSDPMRVSGQDLMPVQSVTHLTDIQVPDSGPSVLRRADANATPASPTQTQFTSPVKPKVPPQSSTDALARWFAELACWIWFSPATSSLTGASLPGTPCRSPTTAYTPMHSSPLASRIGAGIKRGHSKTRSQDGGVGSFWLYQERQSAIAAAGLSGENGHRPGSSYSQSQGDEYSSLRLVPRSRFVSFIRDTLRTTQVSTSVLILALLYIRRLKLLHPRLRGQEGSEYRLCVTALMLGNKFLDDHTYTNKTWSDISGISLKDVTRMEVEFWLGLQMRIHVTESEYTEWQAALENMYDQRASVLARKERDNARRRAGAAVGISASTTAVAVPQQCASAPLPAAPANGLRHSFSYLPPCNAVSPISPLADPATAFGEPMGSWTRTLSSTTSASPLLSLSYPGSHDTNLTSASSPVSQRSLASTSATIISPNTALRPLMSSNGFEWGPNGDASKLELDTAVVPPWSTRRTVTDAVPPGLPVDTTWQQASMPHHPDSVSMSTGYSASSTRPKRRRLESDEECPSGQAKRLFLQTSSGHPEKGRANATGLQLTTSLANAGSAATSARRTPHLYIPNVGEEAASPRDSLYRSVFGQPLTPDCLMQAYPGPQAALHPGQPDRQHLTFYQLAAGRDYGLPAFHLPPPPSHGPWPPARASTRRGSLSLSAYGISPRSGQVTSLASWHTPGGTRQPRTSSGLAVEASASIPSRHGANAVRFSPEAYGVSYGSAPSTVAHTYGLPNDAAGASFGSTDASTAHQVTSQAPDERRWVPFNNVPMNMQLHHLQQWQQVHYFPHVHQQEQGQRDRRGSVVIRDGLADANGVPLGFARQH